LVDAYVTLELPASDESVADRIARGDIRPVVTVAAADPPAVRFVDAASAATHVLLLVDGARAVLRPIAERTPTPGLALPAWSAGPLADEATAEAAPGAEAVERAKATLRLGLMARAIGAAERGLEMSIAHAKDRVAFGKPIGSFQAVSHRAADGATD